MALLLLCKGLKYENMKILIVCSGNSGSISPFVEEQAEALRYQGIGIDFFLIKGYGIVGYLKNLPILKEKIKSQQYDLIHAHYGFSGLLASLQKTVPTIITFHGSDINIRKNRIISYIASKLSIENIFVLPILSHKIKYRRKIVHIIPCGVNLQTFYPIISEQCRQKLGLKNNEKYILFSSLFGNKVKNYPLAKKAINLVDKNINLIELSGYSREKVNLLMNAVDLVLVTSHSESGPLVVKEAMACNCPIVSTDVGDVKNVIGNTEGCYITSYDPEDVAEKIKKAIAFGKRTSGRNNILHLESSVIADKIIDVYKKVLG